MKAVQAFEKDLLKLATDGKVADSAEPLVTVQSVLDAAAAFEPCLLAPEPTVTP